MAANPPDSVSSHACNICGLETPTEESLIIHIMKCHIKGMSSCPLCNMSFMSSAELLIHFKADHLNYLSPDDKAPNFIDDDDDNGEDENNQSRPSPSLKKSAVEKINLNNDNDVDNVKNNNIYNYNNNNNNRISNFDNAEAEGSPLRFQLNLDLNRGSAMPSIIDSQHREKCMLCGYFSDSPAELEEHINREHFDLTSPSAFQFISGSPDGLKCPFCEWSFQNGRDLEFHVNANHGDILSPAKGSTPGSADNWSERCPVCYRSNFVSNQDMIAHVDEHFNSKIPTPDVNCDQMLAKEFEEREKESMKQREQKEFKQLQAQYGMDNQGNFKEQSFTNMQKAVYAGEMSVSDFYERQIGLRFAENNGVDDESSCTRDLIPKIRAISHMSTNIVKTLTCTVVDHFASTYGDEGWGCGYRNLQMLISSLLYQTTYSEHLCKPDHLGDSLYSESTGLISRNVIPSLSKLQQYIELAWREGFDLQGCEQLGGNLHNTRKWIGATEVVTFLSSLRIRCQLVEFDRPTGPNGSHPALFCWVLQYFQRNEDFKPPLYLQHDGHSRTIVGIEEYRDGHLTLLVFDPSHSREQLYQLKTAGGQAGMKLIRRTLSSMKAHQYQVVAVRGIMDSETEYQQSKFIRSIRIP